jgi:dihydrofolate reductase
MRKIFANLFMTLDGVVEEPAKWSMRYWSDEIAAAVDANMTAATGLLVGRITYEGFAAAWPNVTVEQDAGADFMNNTRKYVASTTLETVEWNNSVLLEGELDDSVRALKAENGGDILVSGSPTLVRSLLTLGLLDELHLLIYPTVIGTGQRLFGDSSFDLDLEKTTAFSNGVLHLVYTPAGNQAIPTP